MRRREFITLLGGAAAAWPLAARAQHPAKLPTIGFLGAGTSSSHGQWAAAFVQRLHELGWIEGRTIAIEYRWAEGRTERFDEIAAEFVRRKVDVIVTSATAAIVATKQATSVIPIVFAAAGDPVGTGLVASLARPGGNVTGLSIQQTDLAAKRLELLREVVRDLRRLAILANVGSPAVVLDMREVQAAARTLGLEVITSEIRRGEDIVPAFEALNGRAEALYVCIDPLVNAHRIRINTLAMAARLPTVHGSREWVETGGLMSYGSNLPGPVPARRRLCRQDSARGEAGRPPGRAAEKVRSHHQSDDRQLRLTIPESFLLRAAARRPQDRLSASERRRRAS
jgi:putative tryptophan/tyrosine transport system substrate-binding protein